MASSTAKRLILYRFDRQPLDALGHPEAYLHPTHAEVMTRDGNLQIIDYKDLKAVCFVSEEAPADLFTVQTTFERRPKLPGLWASFQLRDGDVLEGVLPHNLLDWPPQGYLFVPPRSGASRQRVFIPRQAIQETVFRGVVGGAAPAKAAKSKGIVSPGQAVQLSIFD